MYESSFLVPAVAVKAAKIRSGSAVADFGAGSGFFTREAARAVGKHGVVWAVDANRDLLVRVKNLGKLEGLENIEIACGDLESRGGSHLPEEELDFIIAANILFGAEDKPALVEEMWRVLKRHGIHTEAGRALVIDWKDSFGGLGPHPDHVITEAAAEKLFEQGGFSIAERIPAGEFHWGFVVRKRAGKE